MGSSNSATRKTMSDQRGETPPENTNENPQEGAQDVSDESQKPHRRGKRSLIDVPAPRGPDGEEIEEF
ncbi:unnamed protein product [Phyllotreta striolata]|uniref:Uncharacterized protein n=1 Tax=Phyllotreta striolata TaxID=444603 RepID=A0A9N9TY59_PHYSR|nr:unnamed protein product [Phyllotreta striolata]